MQLPVRLEESNSGIVETTISSKVALGWIRYVLSAFGLIGAFATWSRWCWLPNGLNKESKALGLHFFEGWLVFLLLAIVVFFGLYRGYSSLKSGKAAIWTGTISAVICVIFMWRTGFQNATNAAWISLFSAIVVFVFGIICVISAQKLKKNLVKHGV